MCFVCRLAGGLLAVPSYFSSIVGGGERMLWLSSGGGSSSPSSTTADPFVPAAGVVDSGRR